jgi:hypothetical protein
MKLVSKPINPFHREDEYGACIGHVIWHGFNPVYRRLVSSDLVLSKMRGSTWDQVAKLISFEIMDLISGDLTDELEDEA